MENTIKIKGARQHNLKNINLEIPKNKLVVFTGVSGSGKSSLAFDTIYAEGQRRYVESLSSYARQFLGIMDKPDVDLIEGLSPAISIDQKTTSHNPRSTVGTVTEIYDYLRLLFSRIGHPHCPVCGREIAAASLDQIVAGVSELIRKTVSKKPISRFLILSPVVRGKKGQFNELFDNLRSKGFSKARIDGKIYDLGQEFVLIKTNKHNVEAVVDQISLSKKDLKKEVSLSNLRTRITDSLEQALRLSEGLAVLSEVLDSSFEFPKNPKKFVDHLFSEKFSCPVDNIQIPEIEPRIFSFNSPYGACQKCLGLGKILKVDEQRVLNPLLSILEGGISPFQRMFLNDTWFSRLVLKVCETYGIDATADLSKIDETQKKILNYGTGNRIYRVKGTNRFGEMTQIFETFTGIVGELEKRYSQSESDFVRREIEKYMKEEVCPECLGARLKKESQSVTIDSKSIYEICQYSITYARKWIEKLEGTPNLLSVREKTIATLVIKEIHKRLSFLVSVGLNYLTLERSANSLSGGEAQRIRLASQIGSGLCGVLYVLDEPTIGLHPRDNDKLISSLKSLRDLGNTLIVVEHDREMMEAADFLIDFGPGAGEKGGTIVGQGDLTQIKSNPNSLTGKFLSGKRKILAASNGLPSEGKIVISGCSQFNLKGLKVEFPLGKFICVTGVSGSGKSTLVVETLYPALSLSKTRDPRAADGKYKRIEGAEKIDKVILIDQSPIGRTPRSNPSTYTGIFSPIRELFSRLPEARVRGYRVGRFSFNVSSKGGGGRCEACEGQGQTKIEMQFLSDVYVTCEVCKGNRYNAETLEVEYRGKNISQILDLTVSEAKVHFASIPEVYQKLETLEKVGLDYIHLGQSATTLSGGEAQRVKLATELMKRATGKTVYILDEPTTGLHFADLEKLLWVLRSLVNQGNTVIVIEHNLDVIRNCDWIIDLGPEGGEEGGRLIFAGTPSAIKREKSISHTGLYLSLKG